MRDFFANLSVRDAKILLFGMIIAFAACFKLAAHLYRRTPLTWPNAFLVLGAITLKFRAKSAAGEPLTNADAVKISAMGYGFLSIVVAEILGLLLAL